MRGQGKPLPIPPKPPSFWQAFRKLSGWCRDRELCWLFKGSPGPKGYGQFRGYVPARLAYYLEYGNPPEDKPYIKRTCSNRLCCNPHHLVASDVP